MKTFVRWPGNKSKYLKEIQKYLPTARSAGEAPYSTYIEPFVGSGALLLYLHPQKWIINDKNKDIINIWNSIKNSSDKMRHIFSRFHKQIDKINNLQDKLAFCRKKLELMKSSDFNTQRAVLFVALKSCAYMGHIFIKNVFQITGLDTYLSTGEPVYCFSEKYHDNLKTVERFLNDTNGKIYNKDYKQILQKAKENDFVFLDPPYIEDHNYKFTYNKNDSQGLLLDELLKQVKVLDERGVKWLMTQANTSNVKAVFKDYNIDTFKVFRGYTKTHHTELIIRNY